MTFKAGTYLNVGANGLIGAGYPDGNQSLYVGPGNGMVLIKDTGSTIGFRTTSLETGRAWSGHLAADTCLTKSDQTRVICAAAGVSSSGGATNWLQFDSNGYVYVVSGSCKVLGPC